MPNGTVSDGKSKFDDKIEAASAKMYFHYYGQLLHQQNMLQDYVRTGMTSGLCALLLLDLFWVLGGGVSLVFFIQLFIGSWYFFLCHVTVCLQVLIMQQ